MLRRSGTALDPLWAKLEVCGGAAAMAGSALPTMSGAAPEFVHCPLLCKGDLLEPTGGAGAVGA